MNHLLPRARALGLALSALAVTAIAQPARPSQERASSRAEATTSAAASFTILHEFAGPDGASPNSLIRAADGNFYGTTANGGDGSILPDGLGTIFRMDAAGNFTQLHVFHAVDGYIPTGLMQAKSGSFYGTAMSGGSPSGGGGGVLFRMEGSGSFTVLHSFVGGFACCDGGGPQGPPVEASDGYLYGVTGGGGEFRDIDHQGGFGTFYRCDPATGAVTILHSFSLADGNGIFPNGPLVQGSDGFFYGTTREGGGGVFRVDAAGQLALLHRITDSGEPLAGLIEAGDGFLYGTTNGPPGTVFRVSPAGDYAVVNRFDGLDGYGLAHSVMQASDGALYGCAPEGGFLDFQGGTLFRLDLSGSARVLRSFTTSPITGGYIPNARFAEAADGTLYGTTGLGGANRLGTIFRIDPRASGPIASVSVQPSAVTPGGSATGTVRLSSAAPAGGTVVTLGATSFGVTVPTSVTVKSGRTSATFAIQTSTVGFTAVARIYASIGGQGERALLSPTGTVDVPTAATVGDFELALRSPNPAISSVDVEYSVPRPANVQLAVFDVLGRRVATLASGEREPGRYRARWSGNDGGTAAGPGIFFLRFSAPGRSLVRRIALMR